ncbi:MAG: HlyC/CorC family transporter [Chromatiaceae bacterium]|nr:HlyC/CorC family transporter [Gammaproteobacteria bacterium]MCB1880764.1 HlyC/CorC family transporter [Gammaproteobacteria bacterium]MCP5445612.1 HlyC/CorC family transporter [Chromatiaceae bacterium]
MSNLSTSLLFAILALLIMLSALFSGSETALMTLNRYRLKHLSKAGDLGARKASRLLERPDRLIGLILLGNNLVNILASSIATIIALRLGGEAAIAIAAGLLTLVILIFAEVTPKTLAALHPERLAFPAAFVYIPLLKLAYPLVWLVNFFANGLLKGLGVSPEGNGGQALSKEELRTVVAEAGALIPLKHQKMLINILDLEKIRVEEIMIPRNEVDGIDLENGEEAINRQLQDSPYTLMPVFDGGIDNIVGMLHLRNVMRPLAHGNLNKQQIRNLCDPPYFIPEGTSLNTQLINFQRNRRRVGVVVDEYGDLLGLITLSDLLEEIVGEFTTDPSDSAPDIQPQDDGSYLIAGNANVKELVHSLHWNLPLDGPRTINGLITEYLEAIPEPGTSLLLEGYQVEILQTHGNAVKLVRFFPQKRKSAGIA